MLLQAERMTEAQISGLLRTAAYLVVGIPIPEGAAAALFFLPHSRQVSQTGYKALQHEAFVA